MTNAYLYKILTEPEFTKMFAQKSINEKWSGTSFDCVDKFIHLCSKDQITAVLLQYYVHHEFVFVLLVDEEKIRENVKWEVPHGSKSEASEKYPHLYDTLDLTNLRSVKIHKHEYGDVFNSSEL